MADSINDIKKEVKEINGKFDLLIDKLEDKFVMRTEFKVAIAVLSALAVLIGVVAHFTSK